MNVSVGVIGAGGIARFHLQAFAELGVKVPIIADIDRAKAEPYLAQFAADFTDDWQEVVRRPDIDVVCILTPSHLHYEPAKAALESGKHVVCEKTLTLSSRESLELGRLAEAKDLCLYTSYMKRHFPAARLAKELVSRLGHITSVYCRTYQPVGIDMHTQPASGPFTPGAEGISPVRRNYGGGVLVCGGSHVFDLLLYLVGKPRSIYGSTFQRPEADVDSMHHAMLLLEEGGVVHFEANWHPLRKIGFERRGWDEGLEISGVNGRLIFQTSKWDEPGKNAPILRHYDNETGMWTEYQFDIVCPFGEAEKHFLSQIEKGEQGEQDRYTGYRVDYLLQMAALSAGSSQPLGLEWEA